MIKIKSCGIGKTVSLSARTRTTAHAHEGVEETNRGTGDGDYLSTAALALGGAFDDAGKIEELDVGAVELEPARDAGEGGELVGRRLGLGLCAHRQQRRLTHGRETVAPHAHTAHTARHTHIAHAHAHTR